MPHLLVSMVLFFISQIMSTFSFDFLKCHFDQEMHTAQFESISSAFCDVCVSAIDRYGYLEKILSKWLSFANGTPASVRVRVFDNLFDQLWVQILFDFYFCLWIPLSNPMDLLVLTQLIWRWIDLVCLKQQFLFIFSKALAATLAQVGCFSLQLKIIEILFFYMNDQINRSEHDFSDLFDWIDDKTHHSMDGFRKYEHLKESKKRELIYRDLPNLINIQSKQVYSRIIRYLYVDGESMTLFPVSMFSVKTVWIRFLFVKYFVRCWNRWNWKSKKWHKSSSELTFYSILGIWSLGWYKSWKFNHWIFHWY